MIISTISSSSSHFLSEHKKGGVEGKALAKYTKFLSSFKEKYGLEPTK